MRFIFALSLAVLMSGCYEKEIDNQLTRYHEDGRAKPIVAMPMMIDTTLFDASWSIAEELTSTITQMIAQGGKIFIQSQDDFAIAANPFAGDLCWVKREFQNQEFAVFLELAEHDLIPTEKIPSDLEPRNNLNIGIRIRVIDLRGSNPTVVLQEMVRESYYIPKTLFPVDYEVVVWGSDEYYNTPMGVFHMQIAKEIATRVSDYVLLAKSR